MTYPKMPPRLPPRLVYSPLSGRVYVATRYRLDQRHPGVIVASVKHDVTADYLALRKKRVRVSGDAKP